MRQVFIKIETQILEAYAETVYKFKGGRTIVVQIPQAFENPNRNTALAYATAVQFLQAQAFVDMKSGHVPTCEYLIPDNTPTEYASIADLNADFEYEFQRNEFIVVAVNMDFVNQILPSKSESESSSVQGEPNLYLRSDY